MDSIQAIGTILPLALSSGLNLYATVLVAGLCIRFGWVTNVPAGLDILGQPVVILVAAILFLIEAFADKVPFLDNVWDLIHTFIRPAGAVVLGLAALGKIDPLLLAVSALLTGGVALATHSSKASTRMAVNILSPAENVSNIGLSVSEDLVAAGMTFGALKYPDIALVVTIVLLVLMIIFIPQIIRWTWFMFSSIAAWIGSLFQKITGGEMKSDTLPIDHLQLLHHKLPELASKCEGQGIKGGSGHSGYLSIGETTLSFTCNTWFGSRVWSTDRKNIVAVYLRHRALVDVLEVHYQDEKRHEKIARFVFKKDRTALANVIADKLDVLAVQ
jgi:hypothetical protein